MERNERDHNPVEPLRQLGLAQLHRKEDGHNCNGASSSDTYIQPSRIANTLTRQNVRQIADQPVAPVEQRPIAMRRRRPQHRPERLNEAQHRRYGAQHRMRILFARPGAQLDENDDKAGERQRPRQHH